jgi:hypothetical protein
VLENMQDNILGIDFIREHFLSYNSLTGKCFWEKPPIDSGLLKAAERTQINALSSRKIKLKCVDYNNVVIGTNNQMIATINSPHSLLSFHLASSNSTKKVLPTLLFKTAHFTQYE